MAAEQARLTYRMGLQLLKDLTDALGLAADLGSRGEADRGRGAGPPRGPGGLGDPLDHRAARRPGSSGSPAGTRSISCPSRNGSSSPCPTGSRPRTRSRETRMHDAGGRGPEGSPVIAIADRGGGGRV